MSGAAFKVQIPVFMSLSLSKVEVAASYPNCVYMIPNMSC